MEKKIMVKNIMKRIINRLNIKQKIFIINNNKLLFNLKYII